MDLSIRRHTHRLLQRFRRRSLFGWVVFLSFFFALWLIVTIFTREEDPEEFLLRMEAEMTRRNTRIDEICKNEKLGKYAVKKTSWHEKIDYPPVPNYEMFYFNKKEKLSWCPVYKAASTSWLYNFCILAGVSEEFIHNNNSQISTIARKLYPSLEFEEGEQALEESIMKFFTVRHPFERILSAYRDKLENIKVGDKHGTIYFAEKYGRKIVLKYRNVSEANALKNNVRIEPSFEEFARYLIDINLATEADDHWMPFYMHCTPCFITYDAIAKFETLFQDQKYIITKAGLEKKIKPIWKHLTKGKQSSDLLEKYYSSISKKDLIKLYEKYRIDFDMFEYDVTNFFNYAQ